MRKKVEKIVKKRIQNLLQKVVYKRMKMGYILGLLVAVVLCSIPIYGGQFGTNFTFKDLKEMKDDGWAITNEKAVSLSKSGITLDGNKGQSGIFIYDIPKDVVDWTIGATGTWLGYGHSYINVYLATQKHQYLFVLEGKTGEYLLQRDGKTVVTVKGYRESKGKAMEIHLDKNGETLSMSCNSKKIGTYVEKEPSAVTTIGMLGSSNSSVRYSWAGAYIPEPSAAGPVNNEAITPVEDGSTDGSNELNEITSTDQNLGAWTLENPLTLPNVLEQLNSSNWVQNNPGMNIDPASYLYGEAIPPPPIPPEETEVSSEPASESSDELLTPSFLHQVVIYINTGTFTLNTNAAVPEYGAEAEACHYILNGVAMVPYVAVMAGSDQPYVQQEQAMSAAGFFTPESTLPNCYSMEDNKPSFYVTINTHVSGHFETEEQSNAAVAIFNGIITDGQGNTVLEVKITANASEGHNLDYYHCQIAQQFNAYFESLIKK